MIRQKNIREPKTDSRIIFLVYSLAITAKPTLRRKAFRKNKPARDRNYSLFTFHFSLINIQVSDSVKRTDSGNRHIQRLLIARKNDSLEYDGIAFAFR